jgi:hypothetical protein
VDDDGAGFGDVRLPAEELRDLAQLEPVAAGHGHHVETGRSDSDDGVRDDDGRCAGGIGEHTASRRDERPVEVGVEHAYPAEGFECARVFRESRHRVSHEVPSVGVRPYCALPKTKAAHAMKQVICSLVFG